MTKEQEIKRNMKLLKISYEEAEQLYKDDHSNVICSKVAEMEQKAKNLKRRYEKNVTKERTTAQRNIKPDEEKIRLIQILNQSLKECGEVENVKILNQQKEIAFTIKDVNYSVTLIRHRK